MGKEKCCGKNGKQRMERPSFAVENCDVSLTATVFWTTKGTCALLENDFSLLSGVTAPVSKSKIV